MLKRVVSLLFATALCACGGSQSPDPQPADGDRPPDHEEAQVDPRAQDTPEPGQQLPTIPATPAPAPQSLVATLTLPSPQAFMGDVGQYLGAINPAMAAMAHPSLLNELLGNLTELEIDGIDYSKPVHVLFLSSGGDIERLIVATAADATAVTAAAARSDALAQTHKSWVAIGRRAGIDMGSPYGLSALPDETLPGQPTLSLFVDRIRGQYGATVAAMVPFIESQIDSQTGSDAESAKAALRAALAMFQQTDRVDVVATAGAGVATVTMHAIVSKDGSIAEFAAKQKPAKFSGIGELQDAAVLIGGSFDWSDLMTRMGPLMKATMKKTYGDLSDEMLAQTEKLAGYIGGDFAMAVAMANERMAIAGNMSISNSKALRKESDKYFKLLAGKRNNQYDVRAKARAFRHKGVWVSQMTTKTNKNTPEDVRAAFEKFWGKGGSQNFFAVLDDRAVFAAGEGAKKKIRSSIDSARAGGSTVAPGVSAAVERAKQAGESLVILLDGPPLLSWAKKGGGPAGTAGEPSSFGLSFADSGIHLRWSVPASQAKAIAGAISP